MPPNEQESPGAADTDSKMGGQMTPVSLPLTWLPRPTTPSYAPGMRPRTPRST